MLRKFKKTLSLLIAAALIAGLTSCARSESSGSSPGGNTASGKVTITVMNQDDGAHEYFAALGKEFTKLHPNITINYIGVPNTDFDARLQAMIAAGTPPDVTTHVQTLGFMDYYSKGLLTDLTPYMQKYNFNSVIDGIPDSTMAMANVNGEQYGIPLNMFTTVLLYNKDLFDANHMAYPTTDYGDTSWTWNKMIQMAQQLTSGTGANKIYGLVWAWDGGGAMQAPDYFGASLFPNAQIATGRITSNNFAQPAVIQAYQTVADLSFKYGVSPNPDELAALSDNTAADPFYSGKVAMAVEGSWSLAGVNGLNFKVGVAAVPIGGNPNVRAVTYTDPYWIMSGSKHPDEAFQYISFLAQHDNQIKMVQLSGGNPPSSIKALDTYYSNFKTINSADLKKVIEGSYLYAEEDLEHMIIGAGQIHNFISNEMSSVNGGSKTAQEVLPSLQDKLNTLLTQIN